MSSSEEEEKQIRVHIRRKSYYVRFPDAEGSPFLKKEEPGNEKKREEIGNDWKSFVPQTPPKKSRKNNKSQWY